MLLSKSTKLGKINRSFREPLARDRADDGLQNCYSQFSFTRYRTMQREDFLYLSHALSGFLCCVVIRVLEKHWASQIINYVLASTPQHVNHRPLISRQQHVTQRPVRYHSREPYPSILQKKNLTNDVHWLCTRQIDSHDLFLVVIRTTVSS